MFQYFNIFGPLLMLWVLGYIIELFFHKIVISSSKAKPKDGENSENPVLKDAETVNKHIKIIFIVYAVAIIASLIIPLTELRWIFFFACAMVTMPILYDALFDMGKRIFKSKEQFLIGLPSIYCLILAAVTLFLHYFAYMHKVF